MSHSPDHRGKGPLDHIPMPAPIPHIREFDAHTGQCVDVTPNDQLNIRPSIRRLVAGNPSPFTYTGTGTYIIGSGSDTAIIDPGPDMPDHIAALQDILKDCPNPKYLITHTHRDHSPATAALKEALGGTSYGYGPHSGGRQSDTVEEGADYAFQPDVVLHDGDIISGDSWTFEAIHTPGHTSNHMCFLLKDARALFSGDHVMGWSTTIVSPPDGDMGHYKNSLRRLLDMDIKTIFPTHGAPIQDPKPYVEALLDHRITREKQIIALLSQEPQWIEDMVKVMYQDIPSFMHMAAARSVLSHLLHMIEIGTVTSEGPPSKDSLFRLA